MSFPSFLPEQESTPNLPARIAGDSRLRDTTGSEDERADENGHISSKESKESDVVESHANWPSLRQPADDNEDRAPFGLYGPTPDPERVVIEVSSSPSAGGERSEHDTFEGTTQHGPAAQYADTGSTYYSARSRFNSIFTRSTGKRSMNGATWLKTLTKTMNNGFGSGTRVVEGRERGGYLPAVTGVGRTGKAPAPVPASMLKALGVEIPSSAELAASERPNGSSIPSKGFYNLSLEALHRRDGSAVPTVVTQLIEAVEIFGLREKNLYDGIFEFQFSIKGNAKVSKMESLLDKLKNNDASSFKMLEFTNPETFDHSIKTVAYGLLMWFQQLPDPLITEAYFPASLAAVDNNDAEKRLNYTRTLISNLPEAHYATLKVLIRHLKRVAQNSEINCMDAKKLAAIWHGPIMHRTTMNGFTFNGFTFRRQNTVVETIFENFDAIFGADS